MWTKHAAEQLEHPAYVPPTIITGGSDLLQSALVAESWMAVLDFGCATGLWLNYFRGGSRYVGLDQNAAMLEGARRRWDGDGFPEWVLHQGVADGIRLPFADGTFDVVFTCAVLQHNSLQDRAAILPEFRRVLRLGGRYLGYEETYGPFNPTPAHQEERDIDEWGHSQEGWRRAFGSHGFACTLQQECFHVFRAV